VRVELNSFELHLAHNSLNCTLPCTQHSELHVTQHTTPLTMYDTCSTMANLVTITVWSARVTYIDPGKDGRSETGMAYVLLLPTIGIIVTSSVIAWLLRARRHVPASSSHDTAISADCCHLDQN